MLVSQGQEWLEGEERAWNELARLSPADVSRRSKTVYDSASGTYTLRFFNQEVLISPEDRKIRGEGRLSDFFLKQLYFYSRLSILWYLIRAKEVELSGDLINPRNVSGWLIYSHGSHILPLEKLTAKYGSDVPALLVEGKEVGGMPLCYGDASVQLFPFPRVPVVLILWRGDEEFPARTDLLFDSTCSLHLPPDIIWSTAMMSLLVML